MYINSNLYKKSTPFEADDGKYVWHGGPKKRGDCSDVGKLIKHFFEAVTYCASTRRHCYSLQAAHQKIPPINYSYNQLTGFLWKWINHGPHILFLCQTILHWYMQYPKFQPYPSPSPWIEMNPLIFPCNPSFVPLSPHDLLAVIRVSHPIFPCSPSFIPFSPHDLLAVNRVEPPNISLQS